MTSQGQGTPAPTIGLRRTAARGTLINGAFMIGLNALQLGKYFAAAGLVATAEFGVWGVLTMTLGVLLMLKEGLGSKFVQQDEDDQEQEFQRAFTLQLTAFAVLGGVMLVALPLLAVVIGDSSIVAPGLVFIATLPALALKAPAWIFNREMRFAKQRTIEAVDPVVSLFATVGLAVAGFGYWSLVLGYFIGGWAGGLFAVWMAPYKLKIDFDRETAREYVRFTWPLLVANGSVMLIPLLLIIVGEATLGLAGAGIIALAGSIANYADRVDRILTEALYPVICRVKDRLDLLHEAFEKSNRLDLMWGIPFGIGVALFVSDLIHFGIGDQWASGLLLFQVFALCSAANHIGYNWAAFLRAIGDTKPLAYVGPIVVGTFVFVTIPLLVAFKMEGLAAGMAVMTAVSLAVRAYFLKRLFPTYSMLRQAVRAIVPTLPAVAVILGMRMVESDRTLPLAIGEAFIYVTLVGLMTFVCERALLSEMWGYLRGRRRTVRIAEPSAAV